MMANRESVWRTLLLILSGFNGWFCVLSGFFDETEKQEGERLTGVGGFLFRKESLSELHRELAARVQGLKPMSASKLSYHMQDDLVRDIAQITARHRGEAFVCTVGDDDFYASPGAVAYLRNPYAACLLAVVGAVREYIAQECSDEEVFYTIEAGAKGRKEAEDFLRRIHTSDDRRGNYRFRETLNKAGIA
jgi:hypothetical protein